MPFADAAAPFSSESASGHTSAFGQTSASAPLSAPVSASISSPVLAIDTAGGDLRASWHVPGRPLREHSRFRLPLPASGRAYDADFWEYLGSKTGLPCPAAVLIASFAAFPPPWEALFSSGEAPAIRLFLSGAAPQNPSQPRSVRGTTAIVNADAPGARDTPATLGARDSAVFGAGALGPRACSVFEADALGACVFAVLDRPGVRERAFRQGIVVLRADENALSGALIFQDRCFGMFRRPMPAPAAAPGEAAACDAAFLDELREELSSFRLGWLPDEKLRALGGAVRFARSLPGEAEGFGPLFITGEKARAFTALGRVVPEGGDSAYAGCLGLLHGYQAFMEREARSFA